MLRLLLVFVFCSCAWGQIAGRWVSNLKLFDRNNYDRMPLEQNGAKLTGTLGGRALEGTLKDGRIEMGVKLPKATLRLVGVLKGDRIEGTGTIDGEKDQYVWGAERETPKNTGAGKSHKFEPTEFHHFFSDSVAPVLRVRAGDSVQTWSVDAGGTDAKGVQRTSGGNPLTGPFFVEGAIPGDTLAVHFTKIRLNRESAISSPLIVRGALDAGYVEQRKKFDDYDATWKLDIAGGFASLMKPTETMKNYKVPMAPMLGCVGVAPRSGVRYPSGALGNYGGNMDYNLLREGVTVYLPVNVLGALLFVGDGHALQGAGELTGNALETSMDIEFTVDFTEGGAPNYPRMENAESFMASGIGGSLDAAFRGATTNLARWMEQKFQLNAAEVSSVMGTAVAYDVAEVVDGDVHVVARLPKAVLTVFQDRAKR